jgi:LacI family transcriptional regulator
MGLLKAARELGLRVPQDLAVVGFDDLDMADYIG